MAGRAEAWRRKRAESAPLRVGLFSMEASGNVRAALSLAAVAGADAAVRRHLRSQLLDAQIGPHCVTARSRNTAAARRVSAPPWHDRRRANDGGVIVVESRRRAARGRHARSRWAMGTDMCVSRAAIHRRGRDRSPQLPRVLRDAAAKQPGRRPPRSLPCRKGRSEASRACSMPSSASWQRQNSRSRGYTPCVTTSRRAASSWGRTRTVQAPGTST